MKKIASIALAAATAFTITATSFTSNAQAGDREGRIIAGIVLGAIGGAIIAGEINRNKKKRRYHRHNRRHNTYVPRYHQPRYRTRYHDEPVYERRRVRHQPRVSRWQRHVDRCYAAYRTYNERSDTFIGYDGRQHVCRK